jgi:hypothetical protein
MVNQERLNMAEKKGIIVVEAYCPKSEGKEIKCIGEKCEHFSKECPVIPNKE